MKGNEIERSSSAHEFNNIIADLKENGIELWNDALSNPIMLLKIN